MSKNINATLKAYYTNRHASWRSAMRRWRRWLIAGVAMLTLFCGFSARSGTVAYWRFEPGNLGGDSSGNGHDLSVNNIQSSADVATNAAGAGSAFFNGTNAFANTLATLDLTTVSNLTVEFFAKTTQTSLGMMCEHSADINGNPGAFYCDLSENGSGSFRVTEYGTSSFNWEYSPLAANDGAWHHWAVTIDNTTPTVMFNLYKDGVFVTNSVFRNQGTVPGAGINDIFNIGARNGTLFFYRGYMDEMRISDRIVPPAGFLNQHYTNAAIGIVQEPTNTTAVQGRLASFSVSALLTNADQSVLEYQWQRNGVSIPGATGSSYSISSTDLANDNGARFSVLVSAPSIFLTSPVASTAATLTVVADTNPPIAIASYAIVTNFVEIAFNEPLDSTSASDPTRYSLSGGALVQAATLMPGNQTVLLAVNGLTATTYTLSFSGISDPYTNAATGSIMGTNANLTLADIGTVALPGLAAASNSGSFAVSATGSDIYDAADSFSYVYTNITGDFDLHLQIQNITAGVSNTTGGLMAREDTTAGSRDIFVGTYLNAANWVAAVRLTNGAAAVTPSGGLVSRTSPYPNAWVRLTRVGQTFGTFYSTNNLDWVALATSIAPSIPFSNTLLVGIASSRIDTSATYSTFTYGGFQNFTSSGGTIVITTQPTNTTALEDRPVTFAVAASVQGGDSSLLQYQWQTNNVNVPGATSAAFTMATPSRNLSGMGVRCVVSAGAGVAPVASATAILTVTPDTVPPTVVSAFSLLANEAEVVFNELLDPTTAADPTRYSVDGGFSVTGATLESDGMTVLLAVTGLNSPVFQVHYSGVADLAGNPATGTFGGASAGLAEQDIVGTYSTSSSINSFTATGASLQSSYGDIWGGADSFNFVSEAVTNDFDLRAQVVSVSPASGYVRGGLMARLSTDPGSPNIFVGAYSDAVHNELVSYRATQNDVTQLPAYFYRTNEFPNVWMRLKRVGDIFTAYDSPDGFNWNFIGSYTNILPSTSVMLVGLASTTASTTGAGTWAFQYDNFGPTVGVPSLTILLGNGNAVIQWPVDAGGLQLQRAGNLGPANIWSNVVVQPDVVGSRNQVTEQAGSATKFYRLSH